MTTDGDSRLRPPTPAVASAVRILEFIAHRNPEASLAEIAAELNLNKSTAFNILKTLADFGLVARDHRYPIYRLGPKLVELGTAARRNYSYRAQVKRELTPLVERFGIAALIAQLLPANGGVVVVDRLIPPGERVVTGPIGEVYPLWAPAMGRAYLATLPFDQVARLEDVVAHTGEGGLVDLKQQLDEIREQGFAASRGDTEGVNAAASAVTGPDGDVALILCLVGSSRDLPDNELHTAGSALRQTCRRLELALQQTSVGFL